MMVESHGFARRLSDRELRQLLSRRLIANLATIDRRRAVHLVPMWFLYRDGELFFPTSSATRKVKNIQRDSVATAMIHQARGGPNVRGVMVKGPIVMLAGEQAKKLNRRIHRRYMTALGMLQSDVIELLRHDDVTLRLTMSEVISWKISAGISPVEMWSRPMD
jgi:nitroimidazol reductase NimA-like FMN-containing flavoprotein (pyridoxamine 5'-phosphate oxidase superfamily)